MKGREKNIDRIFKDKLRNFDADPPVEVWDSLKGKLYLERRRKIVIWTTRVAAGIAILAALSLTYFLTRDSVKDNVTSSDNKVKTEAEERESTKEVLPDLKSDNSIESQEIEEEVKVAHISTSPDVNLQPIEITIHEELQPGQFQGPALASVRSRSIRQLEYEVPGMNIKPSGYAMPGKSDRQFEIPERMPDEEIYALNIPVEDENPENRWAVGTQVSPLYSYRNLDIKGKSMETANYYNKTESGTLAYSGGLNVNYSPSRRISVQSGLYYSKYGVSVDQAYFFENTPTADAASSAKFYSVNNSSGIIDIADNTSVDYVTNYGQHKYHNGSYASASELSLQVNSGEVIQNFEYLEVPLVLRYRLIDRKIGFNFLGGLSTNLLVSSNTYYNEGGNKEKIGKTTDIKPFNYSSIMGIGIDYSLSKRLKINLEPTFRYYLNSINESSSIRSHPYSLGVFTGVRYYF